MLTGERRPVSGRRGMTVLGKIPAVPKPINLPSQRLENGGLDPNVEIVPRGSVSWSTTGRSPSIFCQWGNSAQSSSSPVGGGPWGAGPPRPSTAGGHSGSAAAGGSLSGTASGGGAWGNAPRPSSAGSGIRPSSAGSMRQTQDAAPVPNAWGTLTARPSSASCVLGDAHSQTPGIRPRSAETRTSSSQSPGPLTRFADQSNGAAVPLPSAWGAAGAARKLGDEPYQPARFILTRVDFPTLGSEKNPELRPQQNKISNTPESTTSGDERALTDERPPLAPAAPYDGEVLPTSGAAYGGQERMPEGWRRESRPYGGPVGMAEGIWHRDGPSPMTGPFGQPPVADTWRREPGHGAAGAGGGPSDDNWRRGGPPVGPYSPPGPGRFQGPDIAAFMQQQRYGLGPGPGGTYGRGGGTGPGGYSRHGDIYGNATPFGRTGGGGAPPRPGPPPLMGPNGLYQGPGPYDKFYGPPLGPGGYGNTDERREMTLGSHGMYGKFSQGPVEGFHRYPPMGPGPGPRHMPNNSGMSRDHNDSVGFEREGYLEGPRHKDMASSHKGGGAEIGRGGTDVFTREIKEGLSQEGKEMVRGAPFRDSGDSRRGAGGLVNNPSSMGGEVQRPSSGGHLGTHRDWGAAASSDEPMDFSKPVFEEDVSSAWPTPSFGKKAPSAGDTDALQQTKVDVKGKEHGNFEEATAEDGGLAAGDHAAKVLAEKGEIKETAGVLQAPKSDDVNKDDPAQTRRQKEMDTRGVAVSKTRAAEDSSLSEVKDHVVRKGPVAEGNEAPERRWGRDSKMSAQASRERSFGREPMFSPHGKASGRFAANKKDAIIASPAMPSTMRSGGQHIGGSNRYSNAAGGSHGVFKSSAAESLIMEESVIASSVHEKQGKPQNSHEGNPTSPSRSDGHSGNNETLRILKRAGESGPETESPCSDAVITNEISSAAEVFVVANASEPTLGKDDARPKTKGVTGQDGEKEWRPKVFAVAAVSAGEVSSGSATVFAKEATAGSAVTGAGDRTVPDLGMPESDDYDYEAQRARMKEIALQRAIQLRKEEDERVKEQKAKAFAKLEELNRRSLVVPAVQPTADEPALGDAAEEAAAAPALIVDSQHQEVEEVKAEVKEQVLGAAAENAGGGIGSGATRGVRSGRNEHGKRERVGDRKNGGGGRSREEHRAKIGSGECREIMKERLAPSSSQRKLEPPLLSQLSSQQQQAVTPQALLPSPPASGHAAAHASQPESLVPPVAVDTTVGSLGSQVHQQQHPQAHPNKPQDIRRSGRQSAAHTKHAARQQQQQQAVPDADRTLQAQPQDAAAGADSAADKNVAWPVGSNSSNSLGHDTGDAPTLYMGSAVANTEASTTVARKKKAKISNRNRQKSEGFAASIDFTPAVVEPSQGVNLDLSSSNESGTEAGNPVSKLAKPRLVNDTVQCVSVSALPQKEVMPVHAKMDLPPVETSSPLLECPGGIDTLTFRLNGDVPSKRPQRKPQQQPARRASTKERGSISQDVRLGDKPHGGEAMIWAPVRSPSGITPGCPTPKGGFEPDGIAAGGVLSFEKKEESVVPPQQTGRARRAELERYTPKPVVKQQAQQQQQEETQQQQQQQQIGPPSVPQQQRGNESTNLLTIGDLSSQISSCTSSEIKFDSDVRQVEGSGKHGRGHSSWQRRQSGNERMNAAKENQHQTRPSESVESGSKSQPQQQEQSVPGQGQHNYHHRNRPLASVPEQQSRPGTYQARPDQAIRQPPSTPFIGGEKVQQQKQQPHPKAQAQAQAHQDKLLQQQGRSSAHSTVGSRSATLAAAASAVEKEPKIPQEGVGPYQPPRPGSSQKKRGGSAENDVQQTSVEPVRSPRSSNAAQMDRQHSASGKYDRERDHHGEHGSHERGLPGHSGRSSHNFRQQGSVFHDRDVLRVHSGSQQLQQQQPRSSAPTQPTASEGAPTAREKDHKVSVSAGQARLVPVSGHGQQRQLNPFPAAQDREQSHGEYADGAPPQQHQRRSPGRHRPKQQQQHAISNEREQAAPAQQGGHQQQQGRYRHSGHERDHQRDVLNAVYHRQQQPKGCSDGHWQQAGCGVTTEQNPQQQSRGELGRAHEQQSTSAPTSQKPHVTPSHADSTLVAPDSHSKVRGPSDLQRQPSQYQAGSQHQKSLQLQHLGHQSSRVETQPDPNRSNYSNGERVGSSPPPSRREREPGHSRSRQRYGTRYAGMSSARGGDSERRAPQSERAAAKQRLPIAAAGGVVTSQVGS